MGGEFENKANSVHFQVKLPTGTELGKSLCSLHTRCTGQELGSPRIMWNRAVALGLNQEYQLNGGQEEKQDGFEVQHVGLQVNVYLSYILPWGKRWSRGASRQSSLSDIWI